MALDDCAAKSPLLRGSLTLARQLPRTLGDCTRRWIGSRRNMKRANGVLGILVLALWKPLRARENICEKKMCLSFLFFSFISSVHLQYPSICTAKGTHWSSNCRWSKWFGKCVDPPTWGSRIDSHHFWPHIVIWSSVLQSSGKACDHMGNSFRCCVQ